MRITQIDIENFRAFRHAHSISLERDGKNLILYGENGSGKSSFFLSLKQFLLSSLGSAENPIPIEDYCNLFTLGETVAVRFHIIDPRNLNNPPTPYEWSTANPTGHQQQIIREAAAASGFLDYRCLLETHFLTPRGSQVNIFDILIKTLIANIRNDITQNTFAEDWQVIQNSIPRKSSDNKIQELQNKINDFNTGILTKLDQLKNKLVDVFGRFGYYDVSLDFAFSGVVYNRHTKSIDSKEVILKVKFFEREIDHHQFLNEAKLSAIGLSIYLSALLLNPMRRPDRFKILVLDDVLIGLDMSNRLPIIKILQDFFSEYQIFLLTHDLEWYEILKQRLDSKNWKSLELYIDKKVEYEVPIFAESKDYLSKAKFFLEQHEYKAAAIYTRTAFEVILKRYCDKKNVAVRYKEKSKELSSDDFWSVVKEKISPELASKVEHSRSLIMNPLSHARIISVYSAEVKEAIEAIEELKRECRL